MMPLILLSCAIFAPALAGTLGLLLPRGWRGLRVGLATLGPLASVVALACHLAQFGVDAGPVGVAWMPQFRMDYVLHADALGLFFAFLVSGIGLLITLYARAYFGPDDDSLYRFYPSLMLFMTAMVGLVLADNMLLMLLFWELTSISSFLLIGWEREDADAVRNATQAFIITGAGGLALMAGLILLGITTGQWSFSGLDALAASEGLPSGRMMIAALALVYVGAAGKSAQWPVHFWLPGAMAAPTPVSAYLHSATMVKAGVYLLGRTWEALSVFSLWPMLILPIGAVTMVLGSYVALRKSDLKQIFAYTTVSQLGLLMCMYGLSAYAYEGEPNLLWDVTQILNHALYKAPLFLVAGAIAHVVHTRELPALRGLARRGGSATILALILILASYAMAAGPFTLSFAAKELFFYQVWHAWEASHQPILKALAVAGIATAALNVAIFVRITRELVGRADDRHRDAHDDAHEYDHHAPDSALWSMMLWLPALGLVAFQLLGGLAPNLFDSLLGPIERNRIYFDHVPSALHALAHPGPPLYMSLVGSALGLIIGFLPIFRSVIEDWHARLYPAFYMLATKGGGWLFDRVQTGNVRTYLAMLCVALVALVGWAMRFDATPLTLAELIVIEPAAEMLPGWLAAALVCVASILMPLVRERASRILMLGTVGFSVTVLFYLYRAPDLALTQISIEIVSLILFLLVLGLLPRTPRQSAPGMAPRFILAVAVGATMFWLTLSSATADRPPMPYAGHDGHRFAHLGEFFLRNSYEGIDTEGRHVGGGGDNVVNVILVDFRGFDTLGEITVLALAAMGVWTLLRRPGRRTNGLTLRSNLSDPRDAVEVAVPVPAPALEGEVRS